MKYILNMFRAVWELLWACPRTPEEADRLEVIRICREEGIDPPSYLSH